MMSFEVWIRQVNDVLENYGIVASENNYDGWEFLFDEGYNINQAIKFMLAGIFDEN